MSVRESIEALQLRAFVDDLDRKWSWWSNKKDQLVAPVIPDSRGLVYLHNYAENYIVAVTPLGHDLVYAAEVSAPLRAISGVIDGKEVVLVLTEAGTIEVFSPTLEHQQSINLSEPATDVVWAEDLLWVVGNDRNHIDIFYVHQDPDENLVFAPFRFVEGVADVNHVMWLSYSRSIVAVATDKVYFISFDEFTVEEVPLPFSAEHAYAHNSLVVFSAAATGEVYCLDLASSLLVDLYVVDGETLSEDPLVVQRTGYYDTWHGSYEVSMVSVSEPSDTSVSTVIQSIENRNGADNSEQPETVVLFEEKADHFNLQSTKECFAGEHYESQPFSLGHDGDPLLVVADGSALVVKDAEGVETTTQAAWVTDEELKLSRQYNVKDGLHFRSRLEVYEPVDEVVLFDDLSGEMKGMDYQFDAHGTKRLFLSDPVEASGFWVGSFESEVIKVEAMRVIQGVEPSVYAVKPVGTTILTEYRLHYRDLATLRSEVTEWSAEPKAIPEQGKLTGYQIRCYVSTTDLNKTPEIPSFAIDQVRHVRLTTGFWDTYKLNKLNAGRALSSSSTTQGNIHSTVGLYSASAQADEIATRLMPNESSSQDGKQVYALGSAVTVHTMDATYKLLRTAADFKLGNVRFKAQASNGRNWSNTAHAYLSRQLSSQSARSTQVGIHGTQAAVQDPLVRMTMLLSRAAQEQLLSSEVMKQTSGFEQDTDYSRAVPHGELQTTVAARTYHNVMTYSDVQYFIGINTLASKAAYKAWEYTFVSGSIKFGAEATYGNAYPSRKGFVQSTIYTGDTRSVTVANDAVTATRYQVPFQAFDGLYVAGQYQRKEVIGYDTHYYTHTRRRLVAGYDKMVAALQRTSYFTGESSATSTKSNSGESVLDYLRSTFVLTNRLALSQATTSWRSTNPYLKSDDIYATRGIWSAKDDLDLWLASPVESNRTFASTKIGAVELRHLATKVGMDMDAAIMLTNRMQSADSIKMTVTSRGAGLAESLSAYPMQAYNYSPSPVQGYSPVGTLSLHTADDLMRMFKLGSTKTHIADHIKYIVTNKNALQELKHTIRYAIDRIMMEAPQTFDFDIIGSTTALLADKILTNRGLTASAKVDPMTGTNGAKTSAPVEPLQPAVVGNTNDEIGVDLRFNKGGNMPAAQKMPFMQVKGSSDAAELFYQVISSWSAESGVDKVAFTRALLSADSADDISYMMSRINSAGSDLIRLVAEDRDIPAAELVKFLTAAYLTSSLPDANQFDISESNAFAGTIELVYKTLLRSTYADDVAFTMNKQGGLISTIALQLLRDAAYKWQNAVFDVTTGSKSSEAQMVPFEMRSGAQWYYGDELSVPNRVHTSTLAEAQNLAYTNHTIKKFAADIGLTGMGSLIASQARLVPYGLAKSSSDEGLVPLRKLAGLSSKTNRLSYTLTKRSSGEAEVMPFALGETKTEYNVVPLRLAAGMAPAVSILEYRVAPAQISRFSRVGLSALGYLGTSKDGRMKAIGSQLGTNAVKGQSFIFQSFTRLEDKVALRIMDGQKITFSKSLFSLQGFMRPTLPQPIGMNLVAGTTSYQDLIKLVSTSTLTPTEAEALAMAKAKDTSLTDSADLTIDAGLKRTFSELGFAPKTGFTAEINTVKIGRSNDSNVSPDVVPYNANDWVATVQASAVDWAFSQLKSVPKAVFTNIDRTNPVIAELVNFKLDKLGLTIDELIELVSAKSVSSHGEEMPFTKASWTAAQGSASAGKAKIGGFNQAVYYHQGSDLNRKKARLVTLTPQPSVSYWADRIETSAIKAATRVESEAPTVPSSGFKTHLAEHTVEYQTLRRTLEYHVTTSIVMSHENTADGLAYTRVAGGQTHYEDGIDFSLTKTTELHGATSLTKAERISGSFNHVDLTNMTGFATHLGERLLLIRDRQLLREIGVNYQNQDALTVIEQGVLLNRLAQRALTNRVRLNKESSLEIAGAQTTHMKVMDSFVEKLPEATKFHITGYQVKAMNDVLLNAESARNAIMNDVAMLVMNPNSLAMKHVESVVIRWAKYLADVTGTKFQINNIENAVDLIKVTVENLNKVDKEVTVFGTTIRLVDAHAQVMQPLTNLHDAMSVKESYAENPVLSDVAMQVMSGFNPKFAAVDLAKATDFRLALATTKMAKATTEHYKHTKIPSVTDALGRHIRVNNVKGYKPRDGMFMNTTYMEKTKPFVLTLTKNDFHIDGSLQLINGRKALTRYVTQRVDITPWSGADSMHLQSVNMQVVRHTLDLQRVEFDNLTGFRSTLSQKAEYWFPKFRHTFPYGIPNWLQDYGHISQGLGNGHAQSPYRLSTDDVMATQELDLIKQKTDSLSLSQSIKAKQTAPATTAAVRLTDKQWVKPLQETAPMMQSARYHQVLMPKAPSVSVLGNAWIKMLGQVDNVGGLVNFKQSAMGQRLPVTVEADRWIVPKMSMTESFRQPTWTQRLDHSVLSRIIRSVQLEISMVDGHSKYSQDARVRPDVKITDVIQLYNAQAHAYVNKDFIRIKPEYVSSDVKYTKWSPFDAVSRDIQFEKLKNFSETLSSTLYHQLRESRYAGHTKFFQTLTSEMATSTDILKRLTPHVRATKTNYSLSLPVGVPVGLAATKDYAPIRDIVSANFWVAIRRDGRGYSLLTDRPIGLRDKPSSSDIRITDVKRINPQTVSNIAKKIEIVLRKTINKIAEDLDFERLAAPSESQAYQKWVANLTEVAVDYWDFKQQKVALSAKEHDDVIRIMRENWFGNQWYAQKPESMTEFYHAMRQALAETNESHQSYRQTLESDSALYNKLVQSDLVAPEVYSALLEAGLSATQADMFFAQAKEVSKAHYMRLKQYQLGKGDVYSASIQDDVSANRVDSLYEQYEKGLATLYSSLKAMGLSDSRIDSAYKQSAGGEDLGGIMYSKYETYQDMVSAVGQAYEQYLLSDPVANMHYRMMKPMDAIEHSTFVDNILPAQDIIDRYKQASVAKSDDLFIEYAVDMTTVLDSIDYSLMKPLPFHDRVDINLPIKFRSEDYRRYKAGIVQIDLMQWLRDLRTKYREELIEKMHNGTARGTYSPRAAMMEAIRNGVVEPILYRDPDDGSWLYRRYTLGDTQYNYIVWGSL